MALAQAEIVRGQRCYWQLYRRASPEELRAFGEIEPLLGQLLRNRGLANRDQARQFLECEREPLGDPSSMAGLPTAVTRLSAAIAADELIAIYGDYDVDGLTATAVLCAALRRLGARVLPFIPHREKDGYGLQDRPLADLREAGASLVITVDCGVTAFDEIRTATAAGLEVIVTDHHPLGVASQDNSISLPAAAAVVNPNRPDCRYPYKELAGVGVAYKVAAGLLRKHLTPAEADALLEDLLELVAIGTLADVMPLHGENRTMVRKGLSRLNTTRRPGLQALLTVARLEPGAVDADRVSYALAPRLNAAGRLEHAKVALELLLSESPDQARALAERLDVLNSQRQAMTAEALELARAEVASHDLGPAIVVAGPFAVGIVGLLAGRLAEEFNRPAIVLRRERDLCVGSARSVAGLNVVEAMRQASEHLERFGGHAMAAGLRLPTERLGAFERIFQQAVAERRGEPPTERFLTIDAGLRASTSAKWSTLQILPRLEPHGAGNPPPIFLTRGLRVTGRRLMAGDCLRLRLSASDAHLGAIVFGEPEVPIAVGDVIDVVYHLRRNLWQGTIAPELELLDWRPASDHVASLS